MEDVVEAARRRAAASPGARLDPPLSLVLDEAANYPLPSLMSEGGGTGISTCTYALEPVTGSVGQRLASLARGLLPIPGIVPESNAARPPTEKHVGDLVALSR